MPSRTLISLAALVTLFAAGGATCPRVLKQYTAPAPVAFAEAPSLDEVIRVVNENSSKIQKLQTSGATLSIPGVPALRVNFSCERPQRVRMIADTSLTGVELDMGSNDHLFWMWVKRNDPPALYYCRHDQFHSSAVRQAIPIEPSWLVEALGVVYLDPNGKHEGPTPLEGGKLGVRTQIKSGDSDVTKLTILDATHGWVLEQHVFDAAGRRLATALASKHRYDPATGVSLPRHVEVQLPSVEMGFNIDVHDYIVNHLDGDPESLWTMPERRDAPLVDLGRVPSYAISGGRTPQHGYGPVPTPVRQPEVQSTYQPQPQYQQLPQPAPQESYYQRPAPAGRPSYDQPQSPPTSTPAYQGSPGPRLLPQTERSNYQPQRYPRWP